MEKWKPVHGFEGKYEVSDYGRIRSVAREVPCYSDRVRKIESHILKPYKTKSGYLMCDLGRGKPRNKVQVHRAVATAFLGEAPQGYEVNHKNLIKTDNRLENLEWVTRKENLQHARDNGAKPEEPHKKKVMCKETGEVFDSSYRAAEWLNETQKQFSGVVSSIASNVRTAVRLNRAVCGFHWCHV